MVTTENLVPFWKQIFAEEFPDRRVSHPTATTGAQMLHPSITITREMSSSTNDGSSSSTAEQAAGQMLHFIAYPLYGEMPASTFKGLHSMSPYKLMFWMQTSLIKRCDHGLSSPGVKQQLLQLKPAVTAVITTTPNAVAACGCLYRSLLQTTLLAVDGVPQVQRPLRTPQVGVSSGGASHAFRRYVRGDLDIMDLITNEILWS